MPLIRRLPKVGFRRKNPLVYQEVKISSLKRFEEGSMIDAELLKSHGLIKTIYKPYKILGDGEPAKSLTIRAWSFSKSAQDKIVKAGGKVETILKNPGSK